VILYVRDQSTGLYLGKSEKQKQKQTHLPLWKVGLLFLLKVTHFFNQLTKGKNQILKQVFAY